MFEKSRNVGGVATSPPRFNSLKTAKLSRLPSLAARNSLKFESPKAPDEPGIKQDLCECGKPVDFNNAFLMNLGVCKLCLAIHSRVEQAIDRYAIEKHKAAKLAAWAEKLGGLE